MKKTRSRLFYVFAILFSAIFIVAVLVGFSACSGCNEEEIEEGATVSDVTVTAEQTSLTVGDTTKLTAAVTMSDGSDYTGSYAWSSGAQDVASVSGSGAEATVTAEAEGTATITVSVSDNKSASVTVSVAAVPTLSISIADELDLDLAAETTKTGTLTATLAMSDSSAVPSDVEVSWKISGSSVATLSAETGTSVTVTALANGTATVTATAGGVSATCAVYVVGPASLALSGSDAALMNAKSTSGSTNSLMSADSTTGAVSNITAGDLVVYQILASNVPEDGTEAAVTVSVPTDASLSDIELYVESEEETNEEDLTDDPTPTALTDGSATITLVDGINYVVLTAASSATSASLSGVTLDWHQEKVAVESGYGSSKKTTIYMGPDIELVETSDTVFSIGTDGKATIEAEDATLFNAVGVTGSTNLLGTEQTTLDNNLTLTNVKNFNTIGDSIVFQVNATQALQDVGITITAANAAFTFSSATFKDNNKILTVNGGEAVQLSGELTNTASAMYTSYGTLTGTISLDAGINYIVITAASTAGTGYLNVDRIDLAGGAHGTEEAARVAKAQSNDERLKVENDLAFDASDLTIDYDPATETYTLNGQGSTMGSELAKAFYSETEAEDHANCQYITFEVKANSGETLTITTYNGKTEEKSFTLYGETTDDQDQGDETKQSTTDGMFVVDLTDHTLGDWEMIIEVEYSDGTTTSYAVVLGTITRAVEEDRVAAIQYSDDRLTVEESLVFDASKITVDYDAASRTYTISGQGSTMGSQLAAAFYSEAEADDHAACQYITFEVAANAGETIVITTYNGKTVEKSWTLYGEGVTGTSTTDGAFVADLTDHTSGDWSMEIEVTYADGMTVTYTVVLGTITREVEESRVAAPTENDERLKVNGSLAFSASSISVSYDADTRTYTISGTGTEFGSDGLANAFWGETDGSSHTSCKYITFEVKANAGETIVITTYNGSAEESTWTLYGEGVTGSSTTDGMFVLDLTNHTSGAWSMEIEVTYADGMTVTYTVVLVDNMETEPSTEPAT